MDTRYDILDRYIYALVDPRHDRKIAYIGQSIDPQRRYKEHLRDSKGGYCENVQKMEWIDELLSLNLKPDLVIIQKVWGTMFYAFEIEMEETLNFRASGYRILSVREEKQANLF